MHANTSSWREALEVHWLYEPVSRQEMLWVGSIRAVPCSRWVPFLS